MDILQICLQMWRGDEQPYEGKRYQLERPLNSPQPLQRPHPPILIGGSGEQKTLRFVARYGGRPSWLETVDSNHGIGSWIEAGEHACIARLNRHRILLGIHPVHIDLRLVVAAKKHSEEMVAKRYFSHVSPTPHLRGFGQRASREHTGAGGECIAGGGSSGVGVFRMWYYSQGHHSIMIAGARAIGVGYCEGRWTLMMGGARMAGATATKMAHYVRHRYRARDDAGKLLQLARWCVDNRLLTQAQDELERLLALDPDHAQARRALDRMRGPSAPPAPAPRER